MKKFILVILIFSFLMSPSRINAVKIPCTMTLDSQDTNLKNAMGSALVYKVQLNPPSFARTNISILAVHLPEPSYFGEYDSYEGFGFIPDLISWRFKLYPTIEKPPTWAGRFDLITAEMEKAEVQVRLSNSKTQKLGPSILTNNVSSCR